MRPTPPAVVVANVPRMLATVVTNVCVNVGLGAFAGLFLRGFAHFVGFSFAGLEFEGRALGGSRHGEQGASAQAV